MTKTRREAKPWGDPDDAPELTDDDFARGVWFDGGEPVEEVVARVQAKARSLRQSSEGKE